MFNVSLTANSKAWRNRPSNTILIDCLTPAALGKLVALYEHSVFTQSTVWQIDAFDLGNFAAQIDYAAAPPPDVPLTDAHRAWLDDHLKSLKAR